jgi:WXG100 family type VII secretion target
MSGFIRVTPEQLNAASSRFNGGAGTIENTLGDLEREVQSLGAEWAGQAQERFHALYTQWQTSARALHDALAGIAQLTGQAGVAYADSEQAIANTFGAA